MTITGLTSHLSRRQMTLFVALALSLAATAWLAGREEEAPAAPAPRRSAVAAQPEVAADWPGQQSTTRHAWPPLTTEARTAWGDKAPPTAAPAAAATAAGTSIDAEAQVPPSPPPFPYQLVGRMTDTRPRVVLNGPQRSLVLGVGDVVDGVWRIEAIEPGGLRVHFLPDGPSQLIAFSSS